MKTLENKLELLIIVKAGKGVKLLDLFAENDQEFLALNMNPNNILQIFENIRKLWTLNN